MPNNESSVGPVIATIIILAVIVLGGLYFWGQRGNNEVTPATTSADLNSINSQSSSDDTSSIQTDLQNTNTESLDTQINAS